MRYVMVSVAIVLLGCVLALAGCTGGGVDEANGSRLPSGSTTTGTSAGVRYEPARGTNHVDPAQVETLLDEYRSKSDRDLGQAMNETDFNRRAAAARIRLERDGVACAPDGIDTVLTRYMSGSDPQSLDYGFYLLGELAVNDVEPERIQSIVLQYVEAHPQDRVCDQALWALGEAGTPEALEHFYRIAGDTATYGPVARERSFCCVAQCGRYSAQTRFEEVPRILEIARRAEDRQTQRWCLQALGDMVPGAGCSSIADYERWWKDQEALNAAAK